MIIPSIFLRGYPGLSATAEGAAKAIIKVRQKWGRWHLA